METSVVFRARSCALGLTSCAALFALVAPGLVYLLGQKTHGQWPLLIVLGAIAAASLFFAAILPSMKYRVSASDVTLRCGPFRWSIPIASIRSVAEVDLGILPFSDGWKVPGYALFTIRYSGARRVRMCATSVARRVVVIETDGDSWGVTPADPVGFMGAIEDRRSVARAEPQRRR